MPPTLKRALALALSATCLALPATARAEDGPTADLTVSGVHVDPSASPLPAAPAASFLVADLDTGDVLAAQNVHDPRPPASTLKMLTALTVLPRVNLDSIYTATHNDVAVDGSKVGIVEGSTYTGRQLFEGMFLVSGNDAANAVAGLNGGTPTTIKQMQDEAERLQADDTEVRNPNGLDADGQVSSAYDLALFARAGMERVDFAEFAGMSNSTFPIEGTGDPTTRNTFQIWNQNKLVTGDYQGGLGVKSGYTTNAGRTLAAAAERDGKRYLVTMMGISGNTYETGKMYLDWAFQNSDATPIGSLAKPTHSAGTSDAAAIVLPSASGDETTPSAEPAATASVGHAAAVQPSSGLPLRLYIALITAAACLMIYWRLRAQHGRAIRRRGPARSRISVDRTDVMV